PDWQYRNVAAGAGDAGSMLTLYRYLLALRASSPALSLGAFALIDTDADVIAYQRWTDGERLLIVLNLSPVEQGYQLPARFKIDGVIALTGSPLPADLRIAGDQGFVARLVETS
ncbi:MAG: DUF3459 domain-containing protein, partial [Oxalobacteraceae bacterium]